MSEIIFTTIHGSRLYGFAHEGSDYDTFTVTDSRSRKLRQSVRGDSDQVTVGIDRFIELAWGGSHQSCEALFSPFKQWADTDAAHRWRPMLESMRVCGGDAFAKYERTITKFCYGDFKRRRHAIRLTVNLMGLRLSGRFSPVATPQQVETWTKRAERYEGDAMRDWLLPRI